MKARIRTTKLPKLSDNQWATFEQEMIKSGLSKMVISESQAMSFNIDNNIKTAEGITPTVSKVKRYGFFSQDSMESLILDQDTIEFRTANYSDYRALCTRIESILSKLCEIVDAFGYITTEELLLTYADLISPFKGRVLSDYFNEGSGVLPLSILKGDENDLQQLGHIEVNRVVAPTKRIFVSLEQIPVIEGKVTRYIPNSMIEPDPNFQMPLMIQSEWLDIKGKHYGLLMTEAAIILKVPLNELDYTKNCESIHILTKETFNNLINKDVCDVDWEYSEE